MFDIEGTQVFTTTLQRWGNSTPIECSLAVENLWKGKYESGKYAEYEIESMTHGPELFMRTIRIDWQPDTGEEAFQIGTIEYIRECDLVPVADDDGDVLVDEIGMIFESPFISDQVIVRQSMDMEGEIYYTMSWHKGDMPAYYTKSYTDHRELLAEMARIAPLSDWHSLEEIEEFANMVATIANEIVQEGMDSGEITTEDSDTMREEARVVWERESVIRGLDERTRSSVWEYIEAQI